MEKTHTPAEPEARRPSRAATTGKVLAVLLFLYVFLLGIAGMSAAFKAMGKVTGAGLLEGTGGPLVSLMVGILATTLVQSSSTTSAAIIALVGAGTLEFEVAVFMIMGANLGTTVTNTLVSLGHITRSNEYKRAFAAATVHDFFNILTLLVLFPIEVFTGFLSRAAAWCSESIGGGEMEKFGGPVKAITAPVVDSIENLIGDHPVALLLLAIAFLFLGLIFMVRSLKSLMLSRLENLFDRVLFKTAGRGLSLGILLTFLVQSSSITTSLAVPLVGAGVITIAQVFPYTLGANIGTTITGVLASTATSNPAVALPVAFFHILFNVGGVVLIWPIRWLPILMAEKFAELAVWNRAVPILYIVVTFYIVPLLLILWCT
jgi:solute carrier family 34 (sodium-dependent phosphate cotransporter)